MPQKACERYIFHGIAYVFVFLNAPKSNNFIFGSFSVSKLVTCFFLNATLFMFVFLNPPFSYLIKMGKMGHFKKNEHKKAGHFERKAREQLSHRK